MSPNRVRLRRTSGWRKPAGAVVVARPSKWGNPHPISDHTPQAHRASVDAYRDDLLAGRLGVSVDDVRRELAGKDLCCWCAPELACHADVLLDVANG